MEFHSDTYKVLCNVWACLLVYILTHYCDEYSTEQYGLPHAGAHVQGIVRPWSQTAPDFQPAAARHQLAYQRTYSSPWLPHRAAHHHHPSGRRHSHHRQYHFYPTFLNSDTSSFAPTTNPLTGYLPHRSAPMDIGVHTADQATYLPSASFDITKSISSSTT